MEPFDSIEKLISEHGSATILRDHIALLKSQRSAKDVEIDYLNILLKQKDVQINNLQKGESNKATVGDNCPYCQQPKGKLLDIRPHEIYGMMGVKIFYYQCENCGKKYDKEQES